MSKPVCASWRYTVSDATIGDSEIERVTAVLRSGWLTHGPVCEEFEARFAEFIDVPAKRAKVVSSCTAALHLALAALGIGRGDEVIVPSLSFVATANCVRYVQARPVFADIIDVNELSIDPEDVRRRITPRTRAVICVHYAGYPARLEALTALCRERGLLLVEDAAHAPGGMLNNRALGTWGDAGCFSFFSNKNLAMGEGGLITMRDAALAERIGRIRSHGMSSLTLDRHKGHAFSYDVVEPGFNFRSSEVAAAIGLAQLERLPSANEQRRALTGRYRDKLATVQGISLPFSSTHGVSSHHIMPTILAPGYSRYTFMQYLKQHGIQTSIHYPPTHLFSDFRKKYTTHEGMLPVTETVAEREVTLPLHPNLSTNDVDVIAAAVVAALAAAEDGSSLPPPVK